MGKKITSWFSETSNWKFALSLIINVGTSPSSTGRTYDFGTNRITDIFTSHYCCCKCWNIIYDQYYFKNEVKWVLGSITTNKTSGGDGIPVELFQILKDDAVEVHHSICQQIWKTQQWPQDGKRSVFIPIPEKGNAKECSNYRTIALISHEPWTSRCSS